MLIFKEINDENIINSFLVSENLSSDKSDNSVIYAGFDDDKLFGLCKIKLSDNYGILEYLFIGAEYRGDNLGDGLLRATLNKLDKMGVKNILFPYENEYLLKKGFNKTKDKSILVDLPSFFNKQCGDCGRKG